MQKIEVQDDECMDPFQSDTDFDEEEQVREYLEATLDSARLQGLPKKHVKRYRTLILVMYFHVFRLRLGLEDPAILPPLKIKTIPGARETSQRV